MATADKTTLRERPSNNENVMEMWVKRVIRFSSEYDTNRYANQFNNNNRLFTSTYYFIKDMPTTMFAAGAQQWLLVLRKCIQITVTNPELGHKES